MLHYILFWALFAGACGYAFVCGGSPERWCAAVFVAGGLATQLVIPPYHARHTSFEIGTTLVDGAMLIALLAIALKSTRYWPSWMAVLQVFQVCSHFVWAFPLDVRVVYGMFMSFWAFPMLVLLGIATLRHRLRLKHHAADPAWIRKVPPLSEK